ncbi:MAG: hypothetical protein QOK31_422 [Solirubrobacteraceae bacterium]|nr:hypothetical protein [Solirubrobacteraceae bacterium]
MRVLFTAHDAYGHVLPMVGVARALADGGHEVRVATGATLCSTVASLGLSPVRAGMSDEAMVAEARRRWPETRHEPPGSWAPRMFSDIAAPAMIDDLAPIIASWRPDLLIREEGEHGGPVAAAAAGVTWLTHGWGSPLAPKADDLYGAGVLDPCPASLYGEEGRPSGARPVRVTTTATSADRRAPRLTSERPLAYVGFGTVPLYRDQPDLIAMVVEGLLSHGYDAVVTTGDAQLARRLTALDPKRVRVEQWVSLPALLASCDLVVSHGGAGTVLAALAAGVPLLLLPRGAPSQERMSRACGTRGAARVIAPTAVTATKFDDAVATLTTDDRFRTAARQLADEIAAMPGAGAAAQFLQTMPGPAPPTS